MGGFEKERKVEEVGVGEVERQHGAEMRMGPDGDESLTRPTRLTRLTLLTRMYVCDVLS